MDRKGRHQVCMSRTTIHDLPVGLTYREADRKQLTESDL